MQLNCYNKLFNFFLLLDLMEIIADLQIHSKYARATSKNISIENLEKYARIKGLNLLGVGDFQHPLRRKEIDEKLTEDDCGILKTANGFSFIWQTEVSLMYSKGGKRRAIHLLIFAPNTKTADKVTEYLGGKGRLDYDGRPIFGIDAEILVKELKNIALWHDRAVLHFLTEKNEQEAYKSTLLNSVKKQGYVILAVFSLEGAVKCSGLDVKRYDKKMLQDFLGSEFKLLESFNYLYHMPSGDTRPYVYTLFVRKGGEKK